MLDVDDVLDLWEGLQNHIVEKERTAASHTLLEKLYLSDLITKEDLRDLADSNTYMTSAVDTILEEDEDTIEDEFFDEE